MLSRRDETFDHLETLKILQSVYACYSTMANQSFLRLGLTFAQSEVLLHLYQRFPEAMETGELLQILQIAHPSLSRTLKLLRQKGYIDCIKGDDQRKNQICLTTRALEIQEQIKEVFQQLDDAFFSQVTEEECEVAEAILCKISQNTRGASTRNRTVEVPGT